MGQPIPGQWKIIHEPTKPHSCSLPDSRYPYRPGTVIECARCKQQWELQLRRGWIMKKEYWVQVPNPDDFNPIREDS